MDLILFKTALTMHIVGFVMLTGIMLADFAAFGKSWKLVENDWQKAKWLREIMLSFPPLLAAGGILVLVAGVTLLVFEQVETQLWFQVKMVLVLLIILNVIFIGPKQGKKLDRLIASNQGIAIGSEIGRIKKRLNFFHISQLLMLLTIFVLCAFRFN